uniref:Putative secreted peptide n=1 Tax=Anopheles braziliensis TaxID=58242 RepID=A0A2M3ZTE7_9DIPT
MRHSSLIFSYFAIRCWYCCCCSSSRAFSVTICSSEALVPLVEEATFDKEAAAAFVVVAVVAVNIGTISVG